MLYDLLPLLRGWKPDRSSYDAQTIARGERKSIVEDTAGWIESISFYSSDPSCKIARALIQRLFNPRYSLD